jgi:phytol kinase
MEGGDWEPSVRDVNTLALVITFSVCVGGMAALQWAAARGWVGGPHVTRKLMHIGTGPVFVLCWGLFDPREPAAAAAAAAAVPLLLSLRFFLVGAGCLDDAALVATVARGGRPQELLLGPLQYGLLHAAAALLYWTKSPTGVCCLLLLCVGDGVAALAGRRFGWALPPWPHNKDKTIAGSAAFWLAAVPAQLAYVQLLHGWGWFAADAAATAPAVAGVTALAAVVESLPFAEVDNLTVFCAGALGYGLFLP